MKWFPALFVATLSTCGGVCGFVPSTPALQEHQKQLRPLVFTRVWRQHPKVLVTEKKAASTVEQSILMTIGENTEDRIDSFTTWVPFFPPEFTRVWRAKSRPRPALRPSCVCTMPLWEVILTWKESSRLPW